MYIPQDTQMLYSFLNMKLRDQYSSLEELADDLDLDPQEITDKLSKAGYSYQRELNRFL